MTPARGPSEAELAIERDVALAHPHPADARAARPGNTKVLGGAGCKKVTIKGLKRSCCESEHLQRIHGCIQQSVCGMLGIGVA